VVERVVRRRKNLGEAAEVEALKRSQGEAEKIYY